jgi:hypothetical protein
MSPNAHRGGVFTRSYLIADYAGSVLGTESTHITHIGSILSRRSPVALVLRMTVHDYLHPDPVALFNGPTLSQSASHTSRGVKCGSQSHEYLGFNVIAETLHPSVVLETE